MIFEEIYKHHFGDLAWCENCGVHDRLNFILINQDGKNEHENIICLCNKCFKAFNDGFISRSDLRYMHIVRMNAHERTLR